MCVELVIVLYYRLMSPNVLKYQNDSEMKNLVHKRVSLIIFPREIPNNKSIG